MKPVLICVFLLVISLSIALSIAEAVTPFELAKKESMVKRNIVKIGLLTAAAFILLAISIYIKTKLKEKSESNVQKIKAIIKTSLKQGQKPLSITSRLTQIYPPQDVREAIQQTLQELMEKD